MRPAADAAPRHLMAAVFLVAFLCLLLQAACVPQLHAPPLSSRQHQSPSSRQHQSPPSRQQQQVQGGGGTAWEEEKVRLGSSPPSCRGKCYACSPCSAVQVPTMTSAAPSGPARARLRVRAAAVPLVVALSNYKPVGWKCQCRDRVFEP